MSLVIKHTFRTSPEQIWKALTDKDSMEVWYFNLSEFKAQTGFEFSFYGQGAKGEPYLHLCKVQDVIENKKLSYSWCYKDIYGKSVVSFDLQQDNEFTTVILTHESLETFPKDNPDFAVESFKQGWTYILGTSLKNYIENTELHER